MPQVVEAKSAAGDRRVANYGAEREVRRQAKGEAGARLEGLEIDDLRKKRVVIRDENGLPPEDPTEGDCRLQTCLRSCAR